jgi:succinoglycan biosynthesis transport protein ExoP
VAIEVADQPAAWARLSEFARIVLDNPDVADACDALFGALRLAPMLESGNLILVTSTEPGEGKTTICSCLAITAALAGRKALLIDGDLRRSSLSEAIGGAAEVGLGEILQGRAEAAAAIRPVGVPAGAPREGSVSFMACGRQSPLMLAGVDWSRARGTLRAMARSFGVVFLDSPPILAANDALLFAGIVDAVLLVVGAGSANLDQVRRAKQQLDAVGTPIIGAVLNRFEPKRHGRSDQPYRGYYRRSPA